MHFSKEIESFIKEFVTDLSENNVAIFAGAGMSKDAGYVNWSELLREIADELGLSVDKERDLISIAQYHVNETKNRAKINRKILEEFSEQAEETENHRILSRLPVTTYWTTNYDKLIEESLKKAYKIVDVKHQREQLAITKPKRDVVIYKMHGDVDFPAHAILTKEQYESYYKTHEHFITALSGDLISKTFLFIGFSFTDPNLDYVLSRLNIHFGENSRQHYCFIKRVKKEHDEELYKYDLRKQELMIDDLKRYKIKALLVDEFSEITNVLSEIEIRFRKKTVFISGSAELYGRWDRAEGQKFMHTLSKQLVLSGFRIVNGFGWGVGSAVINGALEAIYEKPDKTSEDQLIIKPFPQFATGDKQLPQLWEEYRQRMIGLTGVALFFFGNKYDTQNKELIQANGVIQEFNIAVKQGVIPIPIATTGYAAQEIRDLIIKDPTKYYENLTIAKLVEKELSDPDISVENIVATIIKIIQILNK